MQLRIKFYIRAILIKLIILKLFHIGNAIKCNDQFYILNSTAIGDDFYKFFDDTKLCDDQLKKEFDLHASDKTQSCPDELIVVNLQPYSVIPVKTNNIPIVQLNISIAGQTDEISSFFFQFRCLYAPNKLDYLCHSHKPQLERWGHMIWPCRKLELNSNRQKNLYFQFSYTCFQLYSLSQNALDIYVLRKDNSFCRHSLLVTIPIERQLDPAIDDFYNGVSSGYLPKNIHPKQQTKTSPLLFLDTSHIDAIYIYLVPMVQTYRHINVSIFSQREDENNADLKKIILLSTQRVYKQNIDSTTSERDTKNFMWKWTDIDSGKYIIYAFFDDGHCQLPCIAAAEEKNECECPHTSLNLTLNESRISMERSNQLKLMAIGKYAAMIVFVILLTLLLFFTVGFLYIRFWRPQSLARQRPRSVELINRPSVLVLYTDDCQPHSDVVLELCRTLEEYANARCFLDQREFNENPNIRPSIWLVDKLAQCDFVLIIFSECSPRILAGEQMVQRRHFPNYFNTAIGYVLSKMNEIASTEGVWQREQISKQQRETTQNSLATTINNHSTSLGIQQPSLHNLSISQLNRFIFARFAYSPSNSIPPFFACSHPGQDQHVGPFILPEQIGSLIAHLHCILTDSPEHKRQINRNNAQFEHQANLAPLNAAIEQFKNFTSENPNWSDERFKHDEIVPEQKGNNEQTILTRIVQNRNVPTLAEQKELAEQFGLLRPNDEVEGEDGLNDDDISEDTSILLKQNFVKKKYDLVGKPEDYDSSSHDNEAGYNC